MTLGDLIIRIGADVATFQALKDELNGASGAIEKFAHSTESMAIILEANLTLPLERAGERLLEFGEEWKTASNALILGTGEMENGLSQLQFSLSTVFGQVNEGAGEVAAAMAQLATRLDFAGGPLEELTKKLLDLHDVTGEQTIPLVTAATTVFQQWRVSAEDTTAALDHFLQVQMASGASTKSLMDNVTAIGPAFRSMGVSLEDTTNLIGNLSKAGVNVEATIASIQKGLLTMSKAGLKDPLEGLQLIADKIKNAGSEGEAFQIGATAFGKGATTIVEAIRSGKLSLDDWAGSLNLSEATVEETAKTMETLGQKFDNIKNQISQAVKPLAEDFLHGLEAVMEFMAPMVGVLADLVNSFERLPGPVRATIGGALALAAALGPILGIIGGITAAMSALEVPLAAMAGMLGGPAGLVALVVLFGAAFAGWAIYDAVNKVMALNHQLDQLYEAIYRGQEATAGQAAEIKTLEAVIKQFNSTIGNKPLIVSQFDAGGNLRSISDYIKDLKEAAGKIQGINMAPGFTAGSIETVGGKLKVVIGGLKDVKNKADNAGKALPKFSAGAEAAFAALMEKYSAYAKAKKQLENLQQQAGAKSLPLIQLQIADLSRQVYHPTETDAQNTWERYYAEVVKLNRAANIQTSDDTLAFLSDLQSELKIKGMDTSQAFSLLGMKSTADLGREISEIEAALSKVNMSSIASDDDRTRATIAALDKEIAAWRTAGSAISNNVIDTAERIKATWAAAHMDIGQAGSILGVGSETQMEQALASQAAALKIIQDAAAAGERTQLDADNAEIASLQKKAAAFAAIGKQMADDDASRLADLLAARQRATLNTESSFKLLGLADPAELDRQVEAVKAAYAIIAQAAGDNEQLQNAARVAELTKMIASYRAAGKQITDDMLTEFKNRSQAAAIAAMDIDAAFKTLGVVSTADSVRQLELLDAAWQKVRNNASSIAADVDNARAAFLTATIETLRKSGQAASDAVVQELEALKAKILNKTMTIADAYKTLGIQSTQAIVDAAQVAQTALDKINASQKASAFDRLQAQISAADAEYKLAVATGTKTDELQAAQNALAKKRLQEQLNDTANIYTAFLGVVEQAYGALQSALGDVITGAKSVGQAFAAMGTTIEKALVDYVIKNLILTNSTLKNLEGSILDFFQSMGLGGGAASLTKLTAKTATDTATKAAGDTAGAASSAGGFLASIGSIASIVGAVADVVNGIVSYFQNARQENTLNAIEQHTKVMAVTMAGIAAPWESVGANQNTLMGNIHDLRNYAQDLNSFMWDTLQADILEVMEKLDDINYSLANGVVIKGLDALAAAVAAGGSSGSSGGPPAPSGPPDAMQTLIDATKQTSSVLTGIAGDASTLTAAGAAVSQGGSDLSGAAASLNSAAGAVLDAGYAVVDSAAVGAHTIAALASAVASPAIPEPYTPGASSIVASGPAFQSPAAGVGVGSPGAVSFANYVPNYAQPAPVQPGTFVQLVMKDNVISSQRAADELMSTVVAQLKPYLKFA